MRGRVLICRIRPWFSGCGGRTASRARCENCSSLISFIARWPCCPQRFYYTISWGGCQVSAEDGLTRYASIPIQGEEKRKTGVDTSRSVCVGGNINIGAMERRHQMLRPRRTGAGAAPVGWGVPSPFHAPTLALSYTRKEPEAPSSGTREGARAI